MSKFPRSVAVLIVFIVAVIAGCKSSGPTINPAKPPDDCEATGNGKQHHETPLVCVDGSGASLKVHPESIRVWDVGSADHTTPPVIQWHARGGTNLTIAMKDAGCVDTPRCSGKNCSAKVKNGVGAGRTEGDEIQRCRYKITLDGRVLDPDAIIVRCCSDSVADQ
jgi:hypothetical protein